MKILGTYLGQGQVSLKHEGSGVSFSTDPPKGGGGQGLSFSPTDLVAAALGSCVLTTIGLVAERQDLSAAIHIEIEKEMEASPRRIGSITLTIHLPQHCSVEERGRLERAAKLCPVSLSIHPEIRVKMRFVSGEMAGREPVDAPQTQI
ncbi:OsmC family protein [Bryobacter aggregatus]|uniref:OsmC family protein n=1 Tax=Bryobacter aggregatus TaxID=360054 RepID=UPI00068ADB92|nr:OsmC family protein [Bryobacter aggregatus]